MSKTTTLKSKDISRQWYLIDASEDSLGRVSTEAARYLIGKHKASYTPHIDNGDYVIIVNASALKVTGNKMSSVKYYRHSSHPGGLKSTSLSELVEKNPEQVFVNSVKGMLPKNKLSADRLARLKVYSDDNHGHEAQKPKKVSVNGK